MTSVPHEEVHVIVGVDTHEDIHVGFAIDLLGRALGSIEISTTPRGYRRLLSWASDFGVVDKIGVEGTGSYGAGLARWLRRQGLVVVEVDRPDRSTRRRQGKSDPIDAEAAARAVLSGRATGTPKSGDGPVEMIRVLRIARESAVKQRKAAANQLRALVTTAPDELRERLRRLSTTRLAAAASAFRCPQLPDSVLEATRYAMHSLARRWQQLSAEIKSLDAQLKRIVADTAPQLVQRVAINTHNAATLLVTAGDNPDRLHDEGGFAHLTGAAPLDASSGKQHRHRLNRGGDRDANRALHMIAVARLSHDERTKKYMARRAAEGKTKKEVIRCLKRYIAREVHSLLIKIPALHPA